MNAALAVLIAFGLYALGYFVYSRWLSERVFQLDRARRTPAHEQRDGVDYVPTNPWVLFGHHWASITGLSPMLGPAVAVIWGWAPAMLWVVLGALFVGCVHDFAALVVSLRARGLSIGKVTEGVIGRRAQGLFLAIIFFGVALAMGVFTIAISKLFSTGAGANAAIAGGSAVIPSGGLMVLAGVIGWLAFRRGVPLGRLTLMGFLAQLVLVWVGYRYPVAWADPDGWSTVLLAYAFAASVLPVWSLLQPRDFLNSLLLYLGLLICFGGIFILRPDFAAPAMDTAPAGAPPIFPFVFITIACGAASGFHGLVSSGTTAKQLDLETQARPIGYGGMIGESLLGLLAIVAVTAGLTAEAPDPSAAWHVHYGHWEEGLGAVLPRFIQGAAVFVGQFGIDRGLAESFIAVLVVSFALTTLDSATRLLRYNVSEIGAALRIRILGNRFVATGIAIAAIGFFTFYKIEDPSVAGVGAPLRSAGIVLWRLFGTVNQLLAALTLLTVTLYLMQRRRNYWIAAIPMAFMLVTTLIAMVENLDDFTGGYAFPPSTPWPLVGVGAILLVMAVWIVADALMATVRVKRSGAVIHSPLVFPEEWKEHLEPFEGEDEGI